MTIREKACSAIRYLPGGLAKQGDNDVKVFDTYLAAARPEGPAPMIHTLSMFLSGSYSEPIFGKNRSFVVRIHVRTTMVWMDGHILTAPALASKVGARPRPEIRQLPDPDHTSPSSWKAPTCSHSPPFPLPPPWSHSSTRCSIRFHRISSPTLRRHPLCTRSTRWRERRQSRSP